MPEVRPPRQQPTRPENRRRRIAGRLSRRGRGAVLLGVAAAWLALSFLRPHAPLAAARFDRATSFTVTLADHWARIDVSDPKAVRALGRALAGARHSALAPLGPSMAVALPAAGVPAEAAQPPPGPPSESLPPSGSGVRPFEVRAVRVMAELAGGRSETVEYDPQVIVLRWRDRALDPTLAAVRLLERYRGKLLALVQGEIVTWEVVDRLFPRNSSVTVVDAATGAEFELFRLGGSQHADVEPLSGDDAQVLRALYGGEYSWNRRAVLLVVGERRIAASINAMPHGRFRITENEFWGHHCLHALFSRIHKNERVDPRHLLMILAAAGIPINGAVSFEDPGLEWHQEQIAPAACDDPEPPD